MTLGPAQSGVKPDCPFQQGSAHGTKNSIPVQQAIEWLIDTGAEIAVVRANVGSQFDVVSAGFSASPTTGGGGIQVVTGVDVCFTVEDPSGAAHQVVSSRYVGIKSQNAGSNLIGMAQIADVQAEVRWDPGTKCVALRVPAPAVSSRARREPEDEKERERQARVARNQAHIKEIAKTRPKPKLETDTVTGMLGDVLL